MTAFIVRIFDGGVFIPLMNWVYFVLLKYIITIKSTTLLAHEQFGLDGTSNSETRIPSCIVFSIL